MHRKEEQPRQGRWTAILNRRAPQPTVLTEGLRSPPLCGLGGPLCGLNISVDTRSAGLRSPPCVALVAPCVAVREVCERRQ